MEGIFEFRNSCKISGPSLCGKTVALTKLLTNKKFFYPRPPMRIMWVTGSDAVDEELVNLLMKHYPDSQFFYGKPDCASLRQTVRQYDVWVFDDLAGELADDREFSMFFTKTTHHMGCFTFYLTQNPFDNGREAVTRTRNCAYQIFFKNNADIRWEKVVGTQLLNNGPLFQRMLNEALVKPYSFLLCDNRATSTFERGRIIANALSTDEENPICYYTPINEQMVQRRVIKNGA